MNADDLSSEHRRLRFIQASILRVNQYTRSGRSTFFDDAMVQDAVLRRLENLADATHRLSEELKARHPEIPWPQVYGFRNIAAHGYEDLNLSRVWEIVEDYLPALKTVIDEEVGDSA